MSAQTNLRLCRHLSPFQSFLAIAQTLLSRGTSPDPLPSKKKDWHRLRANYLTPHPWPAFSPLFCHLHFPDHLRRFFLSLKRPGSRPMFLVVVLTSQEVALTLPLSPLP